MRLNFSCLKITHILHPRYPPKIVGHILKNKQKCKRVFTHKITQLIIMKMKTKMRNRSHRYDINRSRSKHGHKDSKYKKCLSMMMLICVEQHLSNIWSSIHDKVKQHWGQEKKPLLIKNQELPIQAQWFKLFKHSSTGLMSLISFCTPWKY